MSTNELAYVIITPYTIRKSRTGGVIARLLARSQAELVSTRMFAPSRELAEKYAKAVLEDDHEGQDLHIRELFYQYIMENIAPNPRTGRRNRVMFLLFKGKDAIEELKDKVVGHIAHDLISGETIRETYGDFIRGEGGAVRYFEPAVLVLPSSLSRAEDKIRIWQEYSEKDGGILNDVEPYPAGVKPERTLVLIKPDNFKTPSIRVGNIIDMFSKTGLYIIGTKVVRMSVQQALEFYGPVGEIFKTKFADKVEARVAEALGSVFEFPVPEDVVRTTAETITPQFGRHEFNKIITFMTGFGPDDLTSMEADRPGREKCLALIYQGINAVEKIRSVLGSTDPIKAAPATVRKEFGQNIMVNTAHASDSVENAEREIGILNFEENDLSQAIESFYCEQKSQ